MARFIYGERVNVPEAMIKGGTTYRVVTDHVGSVRLVVDAVTGAVAQFKQDHEICKRAKRQSCWESMQERLVYCNKTNGETGFPPLNH